MLIQGASLNQVQTCIAENWEMMREYYYDQTSRAAMTFVLNPSLEYVQYVKHLGYISIIACGSAEGLSDERVGHFISPYGH